MEIRSLKDIFNNSVEIYKKAVDKAMEKDFGQAFAFYVEAFLPRLNSNYAIQQEFKCFYRLQLANYLCKKSNYYVALPEGDMVSDLILDAYLDFIDSVDNSKFNITQSGRINLLCNLKVDFPINDLSDLAL